MKASLVVMTTLLLSFNVFAETVTCKYVEPPCNEQGHRYQCVIFRGWTEGSYCSKTDQSSHNRFDCAECHGQPKPSQECKTECGCSSAFCGSW